MQTIERFLHSSYDQFAGRATLLNFLPLLAERFARQRLTALARVEGKITHTKPIVLFLCTHTAWSGGFEGQRDQPRRSDGDGRSRHRHHQRIPQPWTDEIVQAADAVITMGCGDACPVFPGKRSEEWAVTDPAGQGIDTVRPIRDGIEERIRGAQRTRDPRHRLANAPGGRSTPSRTLKLNP